MTFFVCQKPSDMYAAIGAVPAEQRPLFALAVVSKRQTPISPAGVASVTCLPPFDTQLLEAGFARCPLGASPWQPQTHKQRNVAARTFISETETSSRIARPIHAARGQGCQPNSEHRR